MRLALSVLAACLLLPSNVNAQEKNILEVGTSLANLRSESGRTLLDIPTKDIHAYVYFALFVSQSVMIEPDISLDHRSESTSLITQVHVGYLLTRRRSHTPYVTGYIDYDGGSSASGSSQHVGYGFGGGYRWEVGPAIVIRIEALSYETLTMHHYPVEARARIGFVIRH